MMQTGSSVIGEGTALADDRVRAGLAAWIGLMQTHAAVRRTLDADLLAAHRLPLTAFEVLFQLARTGEGTTRVSDLAERVLLSRTRLSRVLGDLERAGFVAREGSPAYARAVLVGLTADGEAMLRRATATLEASLHELFARHLSDEELALLQDIWRRLATQPG